MAAMCTTVIERMVANVFKRLAQSDCETMHDLRVKSELNDAKQARLRNMTGDERRAHDCKKAAAVKAAIDFKCDYASQERRKASRERRKASRASRTRDQLLH
jgi:hypothetical protein